MPKMLNICQKINFKLIIVSLKDNDIRVHMTLFEYIEYILLYQTSIFCAN